MTAEHLAKLTPEERAALTWKIAPLKWERSFQDWMQQYSASTPFGSYTVKRTREGCEDSGPWESWRWGYCFDEYYDENESDCATAAEGKELAGLHWINRLSGALTRADR